MKKQETGGDKTSAFNIYLCIAHVVTIVIQKKKSGLCTFSSVSSALCLFPLWADVILPCFVYCTSSNILGHKSGGLVWVGRGISKNLEVMPMWSSLFIKKKKKVNTSLSKHRRKRIRDIIFVYVAMPHLATRRRSFTHASFFPCRSCSQWVFYGCSCFEFCSISFLVIFFAVFLRHLQYNLFTHLP